MSELKCPFYQGSCILKDQCVLTDFRQEHNCGGLLTKCSFFAKEKLKQIKAETKVKIYIRQVQNVYLVKADGLVLPANNLLQIDDPLLERMTFSQIQKKCDAILKKGVKMGYPYALKSELEWKIKQKCVINAVVAGESRLVNEADVSSAMKKTLLFADQLKLESIVIMPCDNGTHDISLISLAQLSAIFTLSQKHDFQYLKSIFICMEDEESEQSFIEYYNRIFGDKHATRNENNAANSS